MATATAPASIADPSTLRKPSPEETALCRFLEDKEFAELAKVDMHLKKPSVLAGAFQRGLIEFGRRNYSMTIQEAKPAKGKDGKPVLDEMKRQVCDKTYNEPHVDNDWSWLTLENARGRKPLKTILDEEDKLPKDVPPLCVRLTTAGLAACAG